MTNPSYHSRILVIDDEDRVREDLCAMFQPLGYDVHVAAGQGTALVNNAKNDARQIRPHVAIVDLRLLLNDDSNDQSGLLLIEEIGPARCILYSAYINLEISRRLADFKTAGWIGKGEHPQKLVDLVDKVAWDTSSARKSFRIEKNSISFEQISRTLLGRDSPLPPMLVEDILCQMFPDAPSVNIETLAGSVKTPTSVNRGRSAVLRVRRKDKIEPLIVKVAREENISREYQNYKKYIEGNIHGTFHAIMMGAPQIFWDLGAITYNFLGSSDQTMCEFSVYYQREQDSEAILKPLQTFFREVWQGLYAGETREISTPLYVAYDRFLKLQKRLTNFPNQAEYSSFRGIDIHLLNPVSWVLKHKMDSAVPHARQAITHGDLHGDNLFVDGVHAWVIDFERSGWGHNLRDFTELEMDIATRLAWKPNDKNLIEFFYLAIQLTDIPSLACDPNPLLPRHIANLQKALDVTRGVRCLARDVAKFGDAREYVWSLLFDSVFVATHTLEDEPQHERALLYGSVLCSRLQHWGKPWPPDEWKPLLDEVQNSVTIRTEKVVVPSAQESASKTEESGLKRVPSGLVNIVSALFFLVVGLGAVAIFLRNLIGVTWQQILASFVILSVLIIAALALLGLVKGRDALNALMEMFRALFTRKEKPSSSSEKTNNEKSDD